MTAKQDFCGARQDGSTGEAGGNFNRRNRADAKEISCLIQPLPQGLGKGDQRLHIQLLGPRIRRELKLR